MGLRRRFASVLKAVLLLVWVVPFTSTAAITDKPLFYQLTKEGQQGWLLGSIHVGRADFYPLPAVIDSALERSQALALEANPNDPQLAQWFSQYALAKQPLPAQLQQRLADYCQQLQANCNLQLAPWLISSQLALLQMAQQGYSVDYGIEAQLMARLDGKPLLELEGMLSQLQMFDSLSSQANLQMLEASLAPFVVADLISAWRYGDQAALQALFSDEFDSEELLQVLLYQRNQAMAIKAAELLAKQNRLFIAVGAAHLVGPHNMVELLRQQGVTVTDCWQQACGLIPQ
ncbi:TraB/GumN family protein [Ferrimonas senticii]|uniref:TraB/GumN family protein n=1 Tax=Ferrimonas senticii TaxID=394566 RepID=UPI0003F5C32B|nr:TraB/GumN family protein [Ferrimonas senticii]